jgi:hypothetical protein
VGLSWKHRWIGRVLLSEHEGALTGKVRLRFLDGPLQCSGLNIFNFLSGLIDGLLTIWVI